MEQLIYHSRSQLPDNPVRVFEELRSIIAVAKSRNDLAGVTGLLVCDPAWFLQVLEGEPAAIDRTMARIEADARHAHITIVRRASIEVRDFSLWGMGAMLRSAENRLAFHRHGIGQDGTPEGIEPDRLLNLARSLYEAGWSRFAT